MSVRATRLLLAALFGIVVLFGAAPPASATGLAQPPTTTAPSVDLPDQPSEADVAKDKNKLVVGVVAVALLGIVVYGHQIRAKRKKKG
ncbi:hypothetical protein [Actinokineospora iranica]|uniref:LPXTG-motif cell wall anchor domain-containing protein n=1 Tax=Actinokineospora iranica TaxID=1271860 RepID=A0A1G6STS0_9PSEU|nr:hypothetical protein [Actinokineospora iranica]SDD20014.1 hypothetical protein SAMN05216174_108159 [Actinokineospora iranica]